MDRESSKQKAQHVLRPCGEKEYGEEKGPKWQEGTGKCSERVN